MTVEAILSIKEPTRIRIDGSPIANVFGNIYSSNCSASASTAPNSPAAAGAVNPSGEIVLECDAEKGEIYVRPVGSGNKPINLFVSTSHATYTLLLRRADVPADTIVLRDRSARIAKVDPASPRSDSPGKASTHVRSLKLMLTAMASDRVSPEIHVTEINRPVQLWVESRMTLVRTYESRGLVGERYLLTNISNEVMVLTEQEFDRESGDVLAVSIEHHNLQPGQSTTVYVIRQGS